MIKKLLMVALAAGLLGAAFVRHRGSSAGDLYAVPDLHKSAGDDLWHVQGQKK